jgi:hypothetical protein
VGDVVVGAVRAVGADAPEVVKMVLDIAEL